MRYSAGRSPRLDERCFQGEIAKIEECLRRHAEWNLDYTLEKPEHVLYCLRNPLTRKKIMKFAS